jgi:hypothetical protein
MKSIAQSLVTVFGLGVAVVGGRDMLAGRAAHTSTVPTAAAPAASKVWNGGTLAPIVVEATAAPRRLWYGGTLAPIVVEGNSPTTLSGDVMSDCAKGGH